MSDIIKPTPFSELLEEIDKGNVVGLWTEIHFRTIKYYEKKRFAFIDAKGSEALVELIRMIRSSGESTND